MRVMGSVLLFFLVVSGLTPPHLTGDGPFYALEIQSLLRTGETGRQFWEAGHLLWRPLIVLCLRMSGATSATAVERALIAGSWLGMGVAVVFLPLWLRRMRIGISATIWASCALIVSNATLLYYQGGSSYTCALAFLLVGLWLASTGDSIPRYVAGGLAFAMAVFLWLPFVFAMAGALLLPWLRGNRIRAAKRGTFIATTTCAAAGLVVYGAVAAHLHLATAAEFSAWMREASHGIANVKGVTRAVFGLAKSLLDMGTDGAIMKRFLLHDPYNPVSPFMLFRASLGKVLLFYGVMAAVLVSLWRGRRSGSPLMLCAVIMTPVILFGIAWQGGDPERYFPLYPALLLAMGYAIDRGGLPARASQVLIVCAALVNLTGYSRPAYARREALLRGRLGGFSGDMLPPASTLITPSAIDGLVGYFYSGSAEDLRANGLTVRGVYTPNVEGSAHWRSLFARYALEAWERHGRVWVARRGLAPRPAPDWGWVEGDDPRVHWTDFPGFFNRLELGTVSTGTDGFVELLPTAANRSFLCGLPQEKPMASPLCAATP